MSLRVTDVEGRTDTVSRVVKVTAPPVYAVSISPTEPEPGEEVEFTVREVVDNPATAGAPRLAPLPKGTLSTMTYGDKSRLSGTAGALAIRDRDASAAGNFRHVFERPGAFKVHLAVDDLNGFGQGVDFVVPVGRDAGPYAPAITTATTTVEQGSCVSFLNANFARLSVKHVGPIKDEDINPVNRMIVVAPSMKVVPFGGELTFEQPKFNLNAFTSKVTFSGSPASHLQFMPPALTAPPST